mmetsp:Transcript_18703/g.31416  ORF Transcript_18703/g.31416 Transcript_18703/m.31416 type:complete len:233 (-) Transcript_18703:37-735(-)
MLSMLLHQLGAYFELLAQLPLFLRSPFLPLLRLQHLFKFIRLRHYAAERRQLHLGEVPPVVVVMRFLLCIIKCWVRREQANAVTHFVGRTPVDSHRLQGERTVVIIIVIVFAFLEEFARLFVRIFKRRGEQIDSALGQLIFPTDITRAVVIRSHLAKLLQFVDHFGVEPRVVLHISKLLRTPHGLMVLALQVVQDVLRFVTDRHARRAFNALVKRCAELIYRRAAGNKLNHG